MTRNIANVVSHTDFSLSSVLQYSVDVLKVKDIFLVGHYGCGGVRAAIEEPRLGIIDNWLMHIRDTYNLNHDKMEACKSHGEKCDKLVELNVQQGVHNLAQASIVQAAWKRGQDLAIHGWVYRLSDGLIKNLDVTVTKDTHLAKSYFAKN